MISPAPAGKTVYTSAFPDAHFPKISTFESLLPTSSIDPHPTSRPAFVDALTGETLSRGTLRRHAMTLASALVDSRQLGLLRGDTVMVLSPNSLQYPVIVLAAIAAGLQVTFANPAYTSSELVHQLTDSNTAAVFAHPVSLPALSQALSSLPSSFPLRSTSKRIVLTPHTAQIAPSIRDDERWLLLDNLLADDKPQLAKPVALRGDDAVNTTGFLYYSSGTTGKAKGVETTHHNMTSSFVQSDLNWGVTDKDIMLAAIPWYHVAGGAVTMLYSIHVGIPAILLPAFTPDTFLTAITTYKPTVTLVAPPILLFLQHSPLVSQPKYNLSSLRSILSGSAPASRALIQGAANRLRSECGAVGLMIGQAYGLTETCAGTAVVPPSWVERTRNGNGEVFVRTRNADEKAGSGGWLQAGMTARLVDNEGKDVPRGPNERGELWVRGPNVMKGYLRNEKATRETFSDDGWFKTGDIAVIDEDGFIFVVDRKKELIKYNGFQVPPAELEAVLSKHPLLVDSGVIGYFCPKQQTELPRAYIVPKDTSFLDASTPTSRRLSFQDEIEAWVRGQVIHYKALRGGVFLTASIPRSAAGKILRRELKAMDVGRMNQEADEAKGGKVFAKL